MTVRTDSEFKAALGALPAAAQRRLAALFVESVLGLCRDPRIAAAVNAAKRPELADAEREVVLQAARSACVTSYTQCGHEADWRSQAGHFVAAAAVACLVPPARGHNPAWDAAMHARMARTCESIAGGTGTENREAEQQYRILSEYQKS